MMFWKIAVRRPESFVTEYCFFIVTSRKLYFNGILSAVIMMYLMLNLNTFEPNFNTLIY